MCSIMYIQVKTLFSLACFKNTHLNNPLAPLLYLPVLMGAHFLVLSISFSILKVKSQSLLFLLGLWTCNL